jgi:pyruvate/2-oxoglutarate dehydrogenase complex dihydrolipoamide dehydrogenase (E3) component
VRAARTGPERLLTLEHAGTPRSLIVDAVLVATGRAPNVDLGLDTAGIAFDRRTGVQVDDHLRTTNRRVYAAGDVCSAAKFTHLSDAHARLVLRNALFLGRGRVSSLIVPRCTYTDPEVAQVGVTRDEAVQQGLAVDTFRIDLASVDRARLDGETEGFAALHVTRTGGRIAGATIVARHAGDLVSEITALMRAGTGIGTLADTIHPYPTQAEVLKKAADAWNRTRLTPTVKQLFARWLAWQR